MQNKSFDSPKDSTKTLHASPWSFIQNPYPIKAIWIKFNNHDILCYVVNISLGNIEKFNFHMSIWAVGSMDSRLKTSV